MQGRIQKGEVRKPGVYFRNGFFYIFLKTRANFLLFQASAQLLSLPVFLYTTRLIMFHAILKSM